MGHNERQNHRISLMRRVYCLKPEGNFGLKKGNSHKRHKRHKKIGSARPGFFCAFCAFCGYFPSAIYNSIKPWRRPRVTASVRVDAPSLPRIDRMWNLMVCYEMLSRNAISRLTRPSARRASTSVSRGVSSSVRSAGQSGCGISVLSNVNRPAEVDWTA